jgi:DNA repair protein RadC
LNLSKDFDKIHSKNMRNETSYTLLKIPEEERPRERLLRHGAESLSLTELMAILLGSGTKAMPVMRLAQEILAKFGSLDQLAEATVAELCQVKGIGKAKAIQLKACFGIAARVSRQKVGLRYKIDQPVHAFNFLKEELAREKREVFIAILQDNKNYVICHQIIAIGTLSKVLIHPREVFYPAVRHKAASLILAHNHPSGDPSPSAHDYELTRSLIEASTMMGIPINDHLIIGENTYFSMRQNGFNFIKF